MSTNDGLTLLGTNCDAAYRGSSQGLWSLQCISAVDTDGDGVDDWTELQRGTPLLNHDQDDSDQSAGYRSAAIRYARHHLADLPGVVAHRVGRVWGVVDLRQQTDFYNKGEGRPVRASQAAGFGFFGVAVVGLAGMAVMWRRRQAVWPLAVHLVATTIVAAVFYGLLRFRIGAEVALVIGAAVALDALWARIRRRDGEPAGAEASAPPEPAERHEETTVVTA
jgi:hypothetical protein